MRSLGVGIIAVVLIATSSIGGTLSTQSQRLEVDRTESTVACALTPNQLASLSSRTVRLQLALATEHPTGKLGHLTDLESIDLTCMPSFRSFGGWEFADCAKIKSVMLAGKVSLELVEQTLVQFPNLEALTVPAWQGQVPKDIQLFVKAKRLTRLTVVGCRLSVESLQFLGAIEKLEFLDVGGCTFEGRLDVSGLSGFSSLTVFLGPGMGGSDTAWVSDELLSWLCDHAPLEELDISGQVAISDKGIQSLANCTSLKSLRANFYRSRRASFSGGGLLLVLGLSHLESLSIVGVLGVAEASVSDLKKAFAQARLKTLCFAVPRSITAKELIEAVCACGTIRHLEIGFWEELRKRALDPIGQLKKLEALTIAARTTATDGILPSSLSDSLLSVTLDLPTIASEDGEKLGEWTQLRALTLQGVSLDASSSNAVRALTLETMNLHYCEIPKAGVAMPTPNGVSNLSIIGTKYWDWSSISGSFCSKLVQLTIDFLAVDSKGFRVFVGNANALTDLRFANGRLPQPDVADALQADRPTLRMRIVSTR